MTTLPWVSDPTPADRRDAAEGEWLGELTLLQGEFPQGSVRFAELVETSGHYVIEVEDGPLLFRFSDYTGSLSRPPIEDWWIVVYDEDGEELTEFTDLTLVGVLEQFRLWRLEWVEEQSAGAADDPDRDHDSREE